tara:strand:- start:2161 stop:2697 length:537 start_codon:yes stop_codon:yes gene_type:complete
MKIIKTIFESVFLVSMDIHNDSRGFFFESYNEINLNSLLNSKIKFVQDNHSYSKKSVIRGLHFQSDPHQQDKLIRVAKGEIYDVVVDVRRNSNTFGSWHAEILSSENNYQLWVPKGFAHGFVVTSDDAVVLYKTTDYYHPECEKTIIYNDPEIGIRWPIEIKNLSNKDSKGVTLKDLV